MSKEMDPRAIALAAQLRAEIAASQWRKVATFGREVGKVLPTDPTTFYNRVAGNVPMPMEVVFASLDILGLDYTDFVKRAMQRVPRQPASTR